MPPRKGQRVSIKTEFKPGVRNSPATEFKKGQRPVFVHPKGTHASPETEFQKGHIAQNFKGIGTPRVLTCGEIMTTIEETKVAFSRGRQYTAKKRISYARYLWQQHHGAIPNGMIVYNNRQGEVPDIEDLELITRAELARRIRG